MDGLMAGFIAEELNEKLQGGRVDKVTQPEKDTVILTIRAGNENRSLLLCASPANPRCHLTVQRFTNPLEPPVFCMMLRKQIMGGRVVSVSQVMGDRIIYVDLDCVDEMGDHVIRRLILEIMGRHSNLLLVSGEGRIIEAVRHVGPDMNRVRQIQPGLSYVSPPPQDKLQLHECTQASLMARLPAQGDVPLAKALQNSVMGLSMQTAEELALRVLERGADRTDAWEDVTARLQDLLSRLHQMAFPCIWRDEDGSIREVTPFPYLSLPWTREECRSLSEAMEQYFGGRDAKDRLSQKSASMVRMLKGQIERCEKKLALQEEELAGAQKMDEYRVMGDVINANLYQIKKGMREVELYNFYDEAGATIRIPLDDRLTPAQNAQKYFKRYQKARNARKTAAEQKDLTLRELDFLESMLLDIGKCVDESELEEIRGELVKAGYAKKNTNRRQMRSLPKSKPYLYRSSDGIEIAVGKNAVQNERLTQSAAPEETWLHAKDMPGSHVIIHCTGEVPQRTLLEAAQLAAWYSKGQRSSQVPIDYTLRRYVKKPGGSPTGFVIYTHQHTLYMTVSEQDIRKIELLSA